MRRKTTLAFCIVSAAGFFALPLRAETLMASAQRVIERMATEPEGTDAATESSKKSGDCVPGFDCGGPSFWGTENLLLGAVIFVPAVIDTETMVDCLAASDAARRAAPPGSDLRLCLEQNPPMRPFAKHGRWGLYAGKTLYGAGFVWPGSFLARKSEHKAVRILGWSAPFVAAATQLWGTSRNIRTRKWIEEKP